MSSRKECIFLAAIIAISLHSSSFLVDAIKCSDGSGTPTTCATDVKKCFIKRDSKGAVTRGCLPDDSKCEAPACRTCETAECNSPPMCRKCHGLGCGTADVANDAYNEWCTTAKPVCRNEVDSNGAIVQGCNTACPDPATNCYYCKTDNCNSITYPTDRRLCYQCSGAACSNLNETMLNPCALYQTKNQKCYTFAIDSNTVQRGCTSDKNALCPITSTDPKCKLCDSPNGCNNLPVNDGAVTLQHMGLGLMALIFLIRHAF